MLIGLGKFVVGNVNLLGKVIYGSDGHGGVDRFGKLDMRVTL